MMFPANTTGTGNARALYRVAIPNAGPAPLMAHHKSIKRGEDVSDINDPEAKY